MKPAISRGDWLRLGASALLCGLAAAGPHLLPVPAAPDPAWDALQTERAQLAGNDDPTLATLRQQAGQREKGAWAETRFARLQERVGGAWTWSQGEGHGQWRQFTISRANAGLPAWTAFVALVESLGREPGLVILSLRVEARGGENHREFALLSLTVRLRWSAGHAERTEASDPFPVVAPETTAPAPGRSAPSARRRPSAPPPQPAEAPARDGLRAERSRPPADRAESRA